MQAHDAQVTDVTIIDGSRKEHNAYDGIYITPNMSGNFCNLHVSNAMSDTVRHRYAGNIQGYAVLVAVQHSRERIPVICT